ncbi:bacillithiol biosynthesis cysteine-adding enzyme BshC [Bacillus mangrovi]|uniref:Putative cysteine ligase BshC n=1 Tax=Metabacillus mangrovi TaxID=1491830 RepID=A0A7X2S3P1_9BACI|nr:bacillithiol biosynthesis cysteine-adding enzyme BshC [Metabacillus mangrovi]MTH52628.1 bacillithiol biosynthesis cysteine-adding enzyme BshC [Metabacillus mangrovi]
MEIYEFSLPSANPFVSKLTGNSLDSHTYFDYDFHQEDVYQKRQQEIMSRSFDRTGLCRYLKSYNEKFRAPAVMDNIDRLQEDGSTVVIGGQQAGLLTGPLYTIHKIISILALAKEQEQELGKPVIPMFWIAGEDHDFEEINHVFVNHAGKMKKKTIGQRILEKRPAAAIELDREACKDWAVDILREFGETSYTKGLLKKLTHMIDQSATYTEFFEWLVMDMFGSEGLVLIQSADAGLREMETEHFTKLIRLNKEISDAVTDQQKVLTDSGFNPIIDSAPGSAHLFFESGHQRLLLYRDEGGRFTDKEGSLSFTEEELLNELRTFPCKFSNNVVTRPVMQELMLPVLGFIAGPGELAYWAELKKVFEVMGIKMPVVVPRLNITILERAVEADLADLNLDLDQALSGDLGAMKAEWLEQNRGLDINALEAGSAADMERIHKTLSEKVVSEFPGMKSYTDKNLQFILRQLDLLKRETEKNIERKHHAVLSKFDRAELFLKPEGGFQERTWNIFYYLNKFGGSFPVKLSRLSYSFNNQHKVVKL